MNRYFTPYYICNTILMLSYPVFRLYLQHVSNLKEADTFGYTRENGVLCTALAVLWVRWKRSATMDHFLLSIYTIGKMALLLLFSLIHLKYGLYFGFACSLLFLFVRQPKYKGPSNMVPITSEEQFKELILKEYKPVNNKRSGKNVKEDNPYTNMNMWLVEFYLDWAETCVYTKPIWIEYSMKYTTQNLRFAEVNLANLQEFAKKYNINTSSLSRQLPTLIMFEDGKEVLRFPPMDEDTKRYMKVVKYSKKEIAKYFDLDERYLATRFAEAPNNNQKK